MSNPTWDETTEIKEETTPTWDDTIEIAQPSKLESAIEGAKEGASFGFLDELGAAMEGAGQSILGVKGLGSPDLSEIGFVPEGTDPKYSEVYQQMLERRRGAQQAAREANPISYGAGAIGGGLLTAGPGMAAAKGIGGLKGAMGVGAAEGGLQGLGSSEAEDIQGMAQDVLTGSTVGAVVPAALKGAGKVAGQAKKLLPATEGSIVNKPTAKIASMIGGGKTADIEEFLSNPELRRKMRETDIQGEIERLTPDLEKQLASAQESAGEAFEGLQREATPQVIGDATIAEPFTKMLQENKGLYSNAAKGHINAVDKILKGKMGMSKDLDEGGRLLMARRYMQNRTRDIKATPEDKQLYRALTQDLDEPLKAVPEMREADELYSKFKGLKEGVETPIMTKGEIDPDKLRRTMASQTSKGSRFDQALSDFDNFVASDPRLMNDPKVKNAIESLQELKQVIDMGQVKGALERSGGPTSQAVNTLGQMAGIYMTGGQSLLALPVTNPVAWTRFVDAANKAGQGKLVKSIEKASPAIRSALVRQSVANNED